MHTYSHSYVNIFSCFAKSSKIHNKESKIKKILNLSKIYFTKRLKHFNFCNMIKLLQIVETQVKKLQKMQLTPILKFQLDHNLLVSVL